MAMMQHPIAALFPEMSDEDFKALKADIEEYGQQVPIVHFEDMILDGWHRYRACQELGIEPLMREWAGECGTPAAYVVSMNLHRRHLSESQRAMIAASLHSHSRLKGNVAPSEPFDNSSRKPELSLADVAAAMQVSERTVKDARVVLEQGTAREIQAVRERTATVSRLAKDIRSGKSAKDRGAARKSKPESKRHAIASPNAAKIQPAAPSQRLLIETNLIERVKFVVTELFSMPPNAADTVGTVRKDAAASNYVEDRLVQAFIWLKDFILEWRKAADAERDPAITFQARS